VPLPPAVKSMRPESGKGELFAAATLSTGILRPSMLNE
jgi:hypothetical protein